MHEIIYIISILIYYNHLPFLFNNNFTTEHDIIAINLVKKYK